MSGSRIAELLGPRLQQLTPAQDSIQGLRMWLLHHRKDAESAVSVWRDELRKAPPNQKLKFIYLANDVLLEGRSGGSEYVNAFQAVLPVALRETFMLVDHATQSRLERILNIWSERGAYPAEYTAFLERAMIHGEGVALQDEQETGLVAGDADPGHILDRFDIPDEMAKLTDDLSKLEELQRTVRSLPDEVFSGSGVDALEDEESIDEFCRTMTDARGTLDVFVRVANEQAGRAQVLIRSLERLIAEEQQQADKSVAALQDTRAKVQQARDIRSELRSHMESLPDETAADEPLPSLADLLGRK